jgi:hypothetical protein
VDYVLLSLSSFVLNSHRFRKMWVESLACLVFVALLIPFPSIPVVAMACGSKEGEPYVFSRPLVVVLNPCMLVPSRP